jgi:dTDP-glucose pyrophosphorylase
MINVIIPLAGKNLFFPESDYPYPKPLIEVNGKTMIEQVLKNFTTLSEQKQYIFIVNSSDCKKYHLDNVLSLLTDQECKIIKVDGETKGAACSVLMAIDDIDNDDPLIIANADQIFSTGIEGFINKFGSSDAGVVTFKSVHPRWSYALMDEEGFVIETAEKRPISKHAIAGFYYFRHGHDFVESTMQMIKKDANIDGLYFIAPSLNEMVLKGKKIISKEVNTSTYHTFYSPQKIKEYERSMTC